MYTILIWLSVHSCSQFLSDNTFNKQNELNHTHTMDCGFPQKHAYVADKQVREQVASKQAD